MPAAGRETSASSPALGPAAAPEGTWADWLRANHFGELFGLEPSAGGPHPFERAIWRPADADRAAAWSLYTELRTRILTQPLAYRAGDEAAALDSVFGLFALTRETLREHEGCTHLASLVVRVLNVHVRPFTARWHRAKVDGRLASTDLRFAFRRQLARLQGRLRLLMTLLGRLAEGAAFVPGTEAGTETPGRGADAAISAPLPFGIWPTLRPVANLDAINAAEGAEVRARRAFYGQANATGADGAGGAVGLALSGGGIRSATFALGVVETLARRGILRQVDFLSTVSGGGYLGSFLTSFLGAADNPAVTLAPGRGHLPFGGAGEEESAGVRHLRNHGKYLAEGGFRTRALIGAVAVQGLAVSLLLLGVALLAVVSVARLLGALGHALHRAGVEGFQGNRAPWACVCLLAIGAILLPVVQTLVRNFPDRKGLRRLQTGWERACVGWLALTLGALAAQGIFQGFQTLTRGAGSPGRVLAAAVLLPAIFGVSGAVLGAGRRLGRLCLGSFGLLGPLPVLVALLWLWQEFVLHPTRTRDLTLGGLTLGLLAYARVFLNVNFASPHRYYRDRLARTYLTRPGRADAREVYPLDPQPLSTLHPAPAGPGGGPKGPYHLVNAALNIPLCTDPELRGRNSDFFVFSKHFCGSPTTGYHPTRTWEALDPHLDLGTAVAISGAAAAPRMGTLTDRRFTYLLSLLNVRLGYWLCRPDGPRGRVSGGWRRWLSPPDGTYFLRELTGWMDEELPYLNVSDGGHIENLGIYELLRRRCQFIVAVDGEADPNRSFGGLLTLTQLAQVDLGVRIEPDLADLRKDRDGLGQAHFALSRIEYPGGGRGLLLYVKTSLTGNESEFLRKYRADHPEFPHQSTAQQLYNESQFEAYRALGEHTAGDLFREDLLGEGPADQLTVKDWFERLAQSLLAEADPPVRPAPA